MINIYSVIKKNKKLCTEHVKSKFASFSFCGSENKNNKAEKEYNYCTVKLLSRGPKTKAFLLFFSGLR